MTRYIFINYNPRDRFHREYDANVSFNSGYNPEFLDEELDYLRKKFPIRAFQYIFGDNPAQLVIDYCYKDSEFSVNIVGFKYWKYHENNYQKDFESNSNINDINGCLMLSALGEIFDTPFFLLPAEIKNGIKEIK